MLARPICWPACSWVGEEPPYRQSPEDKRYERTAEHDRANRNPSNLLPATSQRDWRPQMNPFELTHDSLVELQPCDRPVLNRCPDQRDRKANDRHDEGNGPLGKSSGRKQSH